MRPDTNALIGLAIEAGAEILKVYGGDFTVAIKDDSSPVTEADVRAEAIILAGLSTIAPDVPVVAEESVSAGRVPEHADAFFLVDPLDGSKEFISRNGEFTVNIALIENGVPVFGVVYAPALGHIWWGGEGEGAFHATVVDGVATGAAKIACQPCGTSGFRVVGSRSHGTPELDTYLKTVEVADFVSVGSSLKFCLLAEGRADLYPRFGRTMEWDTAAGDAVLRAAGGRVRTLGDEPLVYGKRDQADDTDFANPFFIADSRSGN
ncbi:3'(2'),5'-bisphosphate nucleotidase CysQ [Pelagibacterium xiamenense]|uniref:3'(2'),5'-bisphosphate nucleotidase CysQ n=1 Tax=Pelagibacterium xiamenense TaxID=2901140 RepID=UPI001E4F08E5|nr:3'(2'),5'-bisphosphate nucleotidase CysQ [Pelagibacterium xiamenense]MCD7059162.1 3'(2'),5'-bisphosphate nucleotidase CysQ [Pelagibacterium xiamenense]